MDLDSKFGGFVIKASGSRTTNFSFEETDA